MKKINEDTGKDNGALNSKKKAGTQPAQQSRANLQADKIEPGHIAGTKKRRFHEDDDLIKKTTLKHGSRRNLL